MTVDINKLKVGDKVVDINQLFIPEKYGEVDSIYPDEEFSVAVKDNKGYTWFYTVGQLNYYENSPEKCIEPFTNESIEKTCTVEENDIPKLKSLRDAIKSVQGLIEELNHIDELDWAVGDADCSLDALLDQVYQEIGKRVD